jgi:hypothetical protein
MGAQIFFRMNDTVKTCIAIDGVLNTIVRKLKHQDKGICPVFRKHCNIFATVLGLHF